ncbi:unnamed protein product [Medioppia subpectinata]|uniref:F-box domain-containing protein n=1 Tax=Medioppia subpectinata TaxID=1979941 RepID=A0A7R9KHG9_9ACAR|nr:unnamed protein product [Medioppia subpectinata]CAG2103462.1 unnamed protein product [Medioppia subpectinata]
MGQQMTTTKTSLVTTDDGNEDNKQQPQIYAKDSLDRFGDDLCALLLSYFPFKDRFRCECVSKQFQRTVVGSVVDINIDDSFMRKISYKKRVNNQKLVSIAIKCPNIETIVCEVISTEYMKNMCKVLDTFRDNCLHLRQIYCKLWSNRTQLSETIGPLVTRIPYMSSQMTESLIHCHRLSQLVVHSLSDVFDSSSGQLLAKNLLKFEFNSYSSDNKKLLSAFVAHNQSLKSLKVMYDLSRGQNSHESVTQIYGQLSRLTQLRELTLDFEIFRAENSLSESLRTIGLNCKQLQRLALQLNSYNTTLNDQTLDSLRYYDRLKRLQLSLNENNISLLDNMEVLEPLKLCHRLQHLSLIIRQMSGEFLIDCDKQWPRLHYLSIKSRDFSRDCLSHISRLPALQTLVIQCQRSDGLRDNDFNDLLSSSPKLKVIEIRVNNEKKFYLK